MGYGVIWRTCPQPSPTGLPFSVMRRNTRYWPAGRPGGIGTTAPPAPAWLLLGATLQGETNSFRVFASSNTISEANDRTGSAIGERKSYRHAICPGGGAA